MLRSKRYAFDQKKDILLLLNNAVITKEEKEKMVEKLSGFDVTRADQAIAETQKSYC